MDDPELRRRPHLLRNSRHCRHHGLGPRPRYAGNSGVVVHGVCHSHRRPRQSGLRASIDAPAASSGATKNFERSPFRDAVLDLVTAGPAEGTPISAVLALPGAGNRDGVDHLLARMVLAGEIVRCGRGRYVVPGRRRAEPTIATTPASVERSAAAPVHTRTPPAVCRERADAVAEAMLAEELGLILHQPAMPGHAELETFRSKVGCLCLKFALSPPFELRALAAGWAADGIPLAHCLRTIEDYLIAHAAKCHSGSSDRLFQWVDMFLRRSASSNRLTRADIGTIERMERVRDEDGWVSIESAPRSR
jgi:hypothetical protein